MGARWRTLGVSLAVLLAGVGPLYAGGGAASGEDGVEAARKGGILSVGYSGSVSSLKGEEGVFLYGAIRTDVRNRVVRGSKEDPAAWHLIHQSIRLGVRDVRPKHRLSFETAMRGSGDPVHGDGQVDVLYAYVDLAPADRWAHARLGRQLLYAAGQSGLQRMDGISGRIALHHLGIEGFAGVALRSRSLWVMPEDGEEPEVPVGGWGEDAVYGVAISAVGLRDTQFRFGVQDRVRRGELTRRHLGIDLHKGLFQRVNIRARVAVDLLQRRLQEVQAGLDLRPKPWLSASVDYDHWQPSFDATTIWSVFATDPYDRVGGRVWIEPLSWMRFSVSGGLQVHPDAVTQEGTVQSEVGRVHGSEAVGLVLKPVDFFSAELEQRWTGGPLGDKVAATATLRARPARGRLDLSLRGDLQRYAFALQPQLAGDYGALTLHLAVQPGPWFRAGINGSAIFSPWMDNHLQIGLHIETLLGLRLIRSAKSGSLATGFQGAYPYWEDPRMAAGDTRSVPGLVGGIGLSHGHPDALRGLGRGR